MVFNYAVLRYVHDVAVGEFVNTGLVVYNDDYIRFEYTYRTDRLLAMFPNMNIDNYRMNLASIGYGISKAMVETDCGGSYVFSNHGGGIVDDLDKEFDRLFERMIGGNNYGRDIQSNEDSQ